MSRKSVRILAMALIVALLLSTTAAFAATYSKTTKYRLNTCGDKLFGRRTTLYVRNTAKKTDNWGLYNDLNVTVTRHSSCGVSRSSVCVPRGSTGAITITTGFGKVGSVEFAVSRSSLSKTYSFDAWNSDGRPIIKIG